MHFFSFISGTFYERLGLMPKDLIGLPLAKIVDSRDKYALETAVTKVLKQQDATSTEPNGTLVNVRVVWTGLSYEAGMTITIGSEGLVVVTRLY